MEDLDLELREAWAAHRVWPWHLSFSAPWASKRPFSPFSQVSALGEQDAGLVSWCLQRSSQVNAFTNLQKNKNDFYFTPTGSTQPPPPTAVSCPLYRCASLRAREVTYPSSHSQYREAWGLCSQTASLSWFLERLPAGEPLIRCVFRMLTLLPH